MTERRITPLLGLWFALVFPSLFVTQKFLGWSGTAAYVVLAGGAVIVWRRILTHRPASNRTVAWLAFMTLALVIAAFMVGYPRFNSHLPGQGSDDDDANTVGALALVAAHSPYEEQTYLGNQLHQLPGAFVLALPFALVGTSAIQNLFWLPVFFLAVRAELRNDRAALSLAWLVLAFSPTVMHQVITGTGHAANTIYVVLGLWWLLRTSHRDVAAIAWGVTLATRANFLLLIPIALGALQQRYGLKAAVRAMTFTLATFVFVTVPFYLHDPQNFGPLEAADRLLRFDRLIPYSGETILLVAAAVAILLARMQMDTPKVFRNCALVQGIAPVLGTALGTFQKATPDLSYATYGTFFSWFAFMGIASQALYQYGHRRSISD